MKHYEKEYAHANDKWRVCQNNKTQQLCSCIEKNAELLVHQTSLQIDVMKVSQEMMAIKLESRTPTNFTVKQDVSLVKNSDMTSGHSSENETVWPTCIRAQMADLHPP